MIQAFKDQDTPWEGDYAVHVRNIISGNPPGTGTLAYVWHMGGQDHSIGHKHHQPWRQLDNGTAWKQSNVTLPLMLRLTHGSSGVHAGPVYSIDVLLGLNLAKGHAKVMFWRCGAG